LKEKNLTEDRLEKVRSLHELAKEIGLSLPKMSLIWCLKNRDVSTVILGASKLSQLKENLSSIEDIEMVNESVMERIHTILDNTPESPLF